ncbi:MAG: ABC transporter permease [Firmicutes bacterium]|nr:ABC transporter permease [Bacillota bacterium]MCR4711185.1 ABC transporter permease [Clostridia bacterium]
MSDTMRFVIKKLLIGVLVVLFVSALVFSIMQLMPGDTISLMFPEGSRVSADKIAEMKTKWGLDQPPVVQFFYWLKNILHGDFGTSIVLKKDVNTLIADRLPYTLALTGLGLALNYLIAIPLGLIGAVKKDKAPDHIMKGITFVLYSTPSFLLGIILMYVIAIKLKVLPISGYSGFSSLILPALTIALPGAASTFRIARSEILDVMDERYVTTAYAKGLPRRQVLVKHILRNAMITVTVMFFLSLPWLIGGSVIVENLYALPGLGKLLLQSIQKQDFPLAQGIILMITVMTVICNILGDIVSGILDPRIRLQ